MESKSKKFTRKLVAFFLAVVMAITCFSSTMTAFAKKGDAMHDDKLLANFMEWADATDEQTLEVLLDTLDDLLAGVNFSFAFSQNIVLTTIAIDGHVDSVDGLFDLIRQFHELLGGTIGGLAGGLNLIGDLENVDLSPVGNLDYSTTEHVISACGKSYRAVNDAKTMVRALFQLLYENSNSNYGTNILGQFFTGDLELGSIIEGAIGGNLYTMLGGAFGLEGDSWKSNAVYNIVANIIFNNTNWFSDEEIDAFKADMNTFNFDKQLYSKLSSELLGKINVLVTYPKQGEEVDSSATRRAKIEAYIEEHGGTWETMYAEAAAACGYDPKLVYSEEAGFENNILLFTYDDDTLVVDENTTLYDIALQAIKLAWNTVLKDTIDLLHVNYDAERGHGSNFDNAFYYWLRDNKGWNNADPAANYTEENVMAWATAVYEAYAAETPEEFIGWVQNNFEHDRAVVENPTYGWKDIDATKLFNQLRYSPLADLYFNMQTGPINLYFLQLGNDNIDKFFDDLAANNTYSSVLGGLNDALVAACKDIFIVSANGNIKYGDTAITAPTLATTGDLDVVNNPEGSVTTIVNTLVGNALKVLEYAANACNMNILNGFYYNNGITFDGSKYNLLESNLEEAMLPLLVSLVGQIYMLRNVHDETWDKAGNAEGVAIIALEEHLAYILPDNDYSVLYTLDADGHYAISSTTIDIDKNGTIELLDVVSIMARDALGFHLSAIAPLRDANGKPYSAYTVTVTDTTSPYDLINSLLVYYAEGNTVYDDGTQGQGLAQLLGVVDASGNSLVNINNDLWTNINNVFNHILPAIGVLTNGDDSGWGKADSYELLYKGIIQSFLNISDQKDTQYKYAGFTGEFGGVRNFLAGLGTVLSAAPLTKTGIGITVYDYILVPLINAIFGARYSGQEYEHVLPYSCYYDSDSSSITSSATPFNSFLHVDALASFNSQPTSGSGRSWTYSSTGDSIGMLGILLGNIYEAFGGLSNSSWINLPGVDGAWQGVSFVVQAISTFIPGFCSELREHSLRMTSAKVANASQAGLTSGSAFKSTTLDITNESFGLNRYYENASGTQIQDPRYFTAVTNIVVKDINGNAVSNVNVGSTSAVIAPGETKKIALSGTTQSDVADKIYVINITYDIFQGKMSGSTYPTKTAANTLYTGVETQAYLYLSTQKSWADTLYTRTGDPSNCRWFDESLEGVNDYVQSEGGGTKKQLQSYMPKDVIVPMSNPSMINDFGLRVRNTSNSWFGSDRAFDGVFAYPGAGQDFQTITGYDANGNIVTDAGSTLTEPNTTVGYAAIDRTTGDILNYAYKDYSTDGGKTWVYNGTNASGGHIGFTDDEIGNLSSSITSSKDFVTRTHVVFTLKEAYDKGLVKYVDRDPIGIDENGVTQYIYNAVFINNPNTALLEGGTGSISWGTGTPGIWLTGYKQTVSKGKSVYTRFIAYDGVTPLEADDYTMYLNIYTSENNNMRGPVRVQIVNDVAANTLRDKYNKMLTVMSQYQKADFASSSSYSAMQVALGNALAAISTPINVSNASTFGSVQLTESKVVDAWTIFGAKAYQPAAASAALPGALAVGATVSNGYWFANKECTMPIYTATPVTASAGATGTVEFDGKTYTTGTDVLGTPIVQGEDGTWYLLNQPKYETEWDTTTYSAPYRYESTTQVSDDNGNLCYEAVSFVFRDHDGNKCLDSEAWSYRVAETNVIVKPNDGNEYRGIYQRQADNLDYYYELAMEDLDSAAVIELLLENVIEARKEMVNVNHHVQSYENMVKVAKTAEAMLITTWVETDEIEVDEEGNPVIDEATGEPVHVWEPEYSTTYSAIQIREAVRVFEDYFNNRVVDRNYIGDKLEAEVVCATNFDYTAFNFTSEEREVLDEEGAPVVDEETGEVVMETVYTSVVADPALGNVDGSAVKYGAIVDGALVNEGEIVYTEESWDNYIHALGRAVEVADLGNADATDYDARISESYSARFNLMCAENDLEEALPETSDITVSGTIKIATNLTGSGFAGGIVGINVTLADGTVVGTSAADGTFTATVPAGTTELIITGPSTIDRTVTIAGDANVEGAVIPVAICDYNRDTFLNATDYAAFNTAYSGTYNVYCDFNGDGYVNTTDYAVFSAFYGNSVAYDALTLA